MDAAIAAVTTLGLTWLVFLAGLMLLRPRGVDVAEARRFVPDVVLLVRNLRKDRSLPRGVRVRLLLLLAYLASPVDLVPDFIPVLGYADDVIVMALALRSVLRRSGPAALERHWPGSSQGLAVVRRLAGVHRV